MATRTEPSSPWPQPTPFSSTRKGKRKWDPKFDQSPPPHGLRKSPRRTELSSRADQNSDSCGNVSNDVISCFPTVDSRDILQNTFTRFVWNNRLPQFSQTNIVDVYLFHGDSDQQVGFWPNQPYPAGHLSVPVDDTWWGDQGPLLKHGQNATQSFYFVLVRNGADRLSQPPQFTFTATQTALPNSILASQSSASAASASASSASAASFRSALSASSASSSSRSSAAAAASNANLQNGSNAGNNFPHWAIALLAVFGFLAFVAVLFVFWLLIRNLRSRKKGSAMRRNSIGSQSPMMAHADPQSPTNVAPGSSIAHEPQSTESGLAPLPMINTRHNVVSSDGASIVSRADSAGGPFSAVDAAAMAAAFRNVMRKPDFADRPTEEGESPEHEADVMNRELAEEGRDIRSVSSSRGVKVETLSDSGDTAH